MISRQLELGLENRPVCQVESRHRGRRGRAHWWFERMRGLVDGAQDWEPAALPGESSETPRWKFVHIRGLEDE